VLADGDNDRCRGLLADALRTASDWVELPPLADVIDVIAVLAQDSAQPGRPGDPGPGMTPGHRSAVVSAAGSSSADGLAWSW
jgi:hypothetical protein